MDFKRSFSSLSKSLKFDKNFIYALSADFFFYLSLFFAGMFLFNASMNRFGEISVVDPRSLGFAELNVFTQTILFQYYSFVFIGVIFFILLYSFFKSFVWHYAFNIKPKKENLRTFFFISSLWIIFWSILFFILRYLITIKNTFVILFLFIILNYFTKILFISLITNKFNIKKGFDMFIDISLKRFYWFIIPYFFELILFFVLFLIFFHLRFSPLRIYWILIFIVFLLFSAWIRKYFFIVVNDIKN